MYLRQILLLVICLLVGVVAYAQGGQPMAFSRAYKEGESYTYTARLDLPKELSSGPTVIDMTVTTKKALPGGRASLLFHWSNLHEPADTTTEVPPDVELDTSSNNMPGAFQPTKSSLDMLAGFFQLASAVADKEVALGDETPVKWTESENSGNLTMGFTGAVKLVSVDAAKKQAVSGKILIQGYETRT